MSPAHYDSYVLRLTDPAAIAHARELVANGPAAGDTIVVARIASGADGINRNFIVPGAPPWSWHVVGFVSFASNTVEILDGWPTGVELYPEYWLPNGTGMIGFWGYTVVAEFPCGDYDDDLDVDENDYHVWKSTYGWPFGTSADGNGNGVIDAADYTVWRDTSGTSIVVPPHLLPPAATVPEPTPLALVLPALAVLLARRSDCRATTANL